MSERFEKLYELPFNQYSKESPVILSAGVLLKDSHTDKVIVQLKFQSVSLKDIKALKVDIDAYDVSGKKLEGIEDYQYLDLSVKNGEFFGSNKAIVLPDIIARSFKISNITVVLKDETVQSLEMPLKELPVKEKLVSVLEDAELIKQYIFEVNNSAEYVPQKSNDLWQCSCGCWNGSDICTGCLTDKGIVFNAYDKELLSAKRDERIALQLKEKEEQERIAEQERLAQEEQEQQLRVEKEIKRKNNIMRIKRFIPVLVGCVVMVVAVFVLLNHCKKTSDYNKANKYLLKNDFDSALDIFVDLGDFKDSEEKIDIILTEKTKLCIEKNLLYDAYSLYDKVEKAGVSPNVVGELLYQEAIMLCEQGDYEKALDIFSHLAGYGDSTVRANELEEMIEIEKGLDYIQPYMNYIGSKIAEDGTLYIDNELKENIDEVSFINMKGTISFQRKGDYVVSCRWTSNYRYTAKTIEEVKDNLGKLFVYEEESVEDEWHTCLYTCELSDLCYQIYFDYEKEDGYARTIYLTFELVE